MVFITPNLSLGETVPDVYLNYIIHTYDRADYTNNFIR